MDPAVEKIWWTCSSRHTNMRLRSVCWACGETRLVHSTRDKEESRDKPDMVNHPPHYADTRIECYDAISAMVEKWGGEEAMCGANVIKYVWRHRGKTPVESLKKARWYLDKLIALAEAKPQ